MTPANQSPEFPSVGARARFTTPHDAPGFVLARNGQVGVIEDLGGRYDVPFAASIRFDDGGQLWAYADELSPLPAAPTNEVDWRDDTIAARMVKDNGHHDPSAAAPLQEDTK